MASASTAAGISDADLAVLQPQYRAVLEILRQHKLGWPLEELAGAVTLKVVAITWQQVTEAAPELAEANRARH